MGDSFAQGHPLRELYAARNHPLHPALHSQYRRPRPHLYLVLCRSPRGVRRHRFRPAGERAGLASAASESEVSLKTLAEKFWPKVKKTKGCWNWTATKMWNGYGVIGHEGKNVLAHRVAWFLECGEWPKQTIDHLCRNRACVRVSHMEDISMKENILRGGGACAENARKVCCLRGHPLDGENLYMTGDGRRVCRACKRIHMRALRLRRKENVLIQR